MFEATVVNNSDNEKQVYFGASDTTFKEWYHSHIQDFSHEHYCKCTELLKYIWQFKRNKKSLVLNGKLLENCFVMQKAITVYCV